MCPNDNNNNIPVKQEENKQQEHLPVGADVLQGLFPLQEILLCNAPPAMEIKEPPSSKQGELSPVLLGLRKGVDGLMLEFLVKSLSRGYET